MLASAVLASLLLAPGGALAADGDVTVSVVSDTTWVVDDADAGVGPSLSLPGAAQRVCLNDASPAGCPADATRYGWSGPGWGADLSSIAGAWWVWAPGITGATSPADNDTYTFTKTMSLPGTPTAGTVSVAADDGAQVSVNGTSVGSATGQGALATFDITALLVEGENTIIVTGTNAAICGQPCTYAQNPAGVVFGASMTYTPAASPDPGASAAPSASAVVPTLPPTSTDAVVVPGSGAPVLAIATLAIGLAIAAVVLAMTPRRRTVRDRSSHQHRD